MPAKENFEFDHLAIPIGPAKGLLQKYMKIFGMLGFDTEFYTERVGNEETAMETAVMTRGKVKIALMRGIDNGDDRFSHEFASSQVNSFYYCFGMSPQHIAVRCDDIRKLAGEWREKGIKFLTAYDDGTPMILIDRKPDAAVLQCFTYPFAGSWFFELKQVVQGEDLKKIEEFRTENIRGLWNALDRAIKQDNIFNRDIFGNKVNPNKD